MAVAGIQPRGPAGKLDAVQVLRAVAAMLVVFGHVIGAVRHHPEDLGRITQFRFGGGVGVDIFFLISGFIMVYASGRMFGSVGGARDFIIRRLVRIVPLYWMMTLVAVMLLVVAGKALPSPAALAASFAFIPYDTTGRGDGFAFPLVDLGWTLNYEMMFYVVFALFVPLRRGKAVLGVALAMAALVAIGFAVHPAAIAPRFWTQPIVLEFVAGMLVAWARIEGRIATGRLQRLALIVLAVVIYVVDPMGLIGQPTTPNDFTRVIGWGVPSLLILVATVAGPTPLAGRTGQTLVLLGDASYALYLLHPLVIVVMLRVARLPLFPEAGRAAIFVACTLMAACIGAVVLHRLIERPLTQRLTAWLQRRGAPIAAVPLPPEARL